jgi:hypothetical protein
MDNALDCNMKMTTVKPNINFIFTYDKKWNEWTFKCKLYWIEMLHMYIIENGENKMLNTKKIIILSPTEPSTLVIFNATLNSLCL